VGYAKSSITGNPMAFDEPTFKAHRLAIEGSKFFFNELANPENVNTYFPPRPMQEDYAISPHVSFPVTSDVLNRIASIVYSDATITVDPPSLQPDLDMMLARNNWPGFGRDCIIKAMYGADYLVTIIPQESRGVKFKSWTGEWAFVENRGEENEVVGYQYKLGKDGTRSPTTGRALTSDTYVEVRIDKTNWGTAKEGKAHDFGFTPATMFYNIDMTDESPYPNPFHIRFKDQLLEYNKMFSKVIKDLRILESVWWTNANPQGDPNHPINMDGNLLFLPEGTTLQQALSTYDIGPKEKALNMLRNHIATSAQVPDFMTGLDNVGKVESGVALNITLAPLTEIVNRIIYQFKPCFIELFAKALQVELILMGTSASDFAIDIEFTKNVIPVDKEREVNLLISLKEKGIINDAECRAKILPLMDIEPIEMKSLKSQKEEAVQ
jgi:hypothetical protein